jgi:hypothetical protein
MEAGASGPTLVISDTRATILPFLGRVEVSVDVVVIDGYVWLGAERPGLGVKL